MKTKGLIVICYLITISCVSKQQKFIQAEFDKIIGTWKVQSYTYEGSVPDSLRTFIKPGELLFEKCYYKQKDFSVCGGKIDINGFIFNNVYEYDYSTKLFRFKGFGAYGDNPTALMFKTVRNSTLLLEGDWDLTVTENTLTAKQTKNANKIGGLVSYTAIRK